MTLKRGRLLDRIGARAWMQAQTLLRPIRREWWVDPLIIVGGLGLFYGLVNVAREWTGVHRPALELSLSPLALPAYTFFSLIRGLVAYVLSLAFTLVYAFWAAKDPRAEKILIPLLDILQSIPVLGFMPGLVLALASLFPRSNIGLELAAVLMIFTGQAWNMTFSLYHSFKSVPLDLQEAAITYRFGWWERLRSAELPYGAQGLVWNSMMSMAGGWFFLMINESFRLGDHDFRLPGLGSYMTVAVAKGDGAAMVWAVVAMTLMIVALDQIVWRPVVVWAQQFRVEETAAAEVSQSWFLELLRRSHLVRRGRLAWSRWRRTVATRALSRSSGRAAVAPTAAATVVSTSPWSLAPLALLIATMAWGSFRLLHLLAHLPDGTWPGLSLAASATLFRVLVATALGTVWTVPVGLAIGLSPRLSRALQPVVQVAASFPAPMLFPLVIALLHEAGVGLGIGSIVLMLLGTQWYILFNVIAGAGSVPSDLREAVKSFGFPRGERVWSLYLPATFPYLVTGWVTAAGGAWNASIVSEYVSYKGATLTTLGLGAAITQAAEQGNMATLAAGVLVMSVVVVTFNRLVWRRCYSLASSRYSLTK
jgi:NitT/TauT family transport system permease protein